MRQWLPRKLLPVLAVPILLISLAQVSVPMLITILDEGVSQSTVIRKLNCVGSMIACTTATDTGTLTLTADTHAILSATHTDTLAASVVRGDMIVANSTPAWSRLGIGGYGAVMFSNGTDATWGATGAFVCCVVSSDRTTASATYADITGLTIAGLPANLSWGFDCDIIFQSANTTEGQAFAINLTGGTAPAIIHYVVGIQNVANATASTALMNEVGLVTADGMTATASTITSGANLAARVRGDFNSGTSGTVTFAVRWRNETGTAINITAKTGSHCVLQRTI